MQYESSIISGLEVMAKVKVFVHATDADPRLREGRNILQDIRSGEEQYFTGLNQNLPDRQI